jgi:hypothetical protein
MAGDWSRRAKTVDPSPAASLFELGVDDHFDLTALAGLTLANRRRLLLSPRL